MKKIINPMLISVAVMILVSACGNQSSTDEARISTYVAATAAAREAATALVDKALADVLTGTASVPTVTPTTTLTPTPTETVTPTPPPLATVIIENAPVFAGPAVYYALIVKLSLGDQVEILGKSENEAWLWVQLADGTQGWVALELVELTGEITQFTVVEAPPTPDIDFTITIVNNHDGGIRFVIVGFLERVTVKAGETFQISIPLGRYTFKYVPNFQTGPIGTRTCEKTFTISFDIYWAPEKNAGCDSFP